MAERESLITAARPEPYFVRSCRICGMEIRTPWGQEVHAESAFALRNHVEIHSERELVEYALREALRGV